MGRDAWICLLFIVAYAGALILPRGLNCFLRDFLEMLTSSNSACQDYHIHLIFVVILDYTSKVESTQSKSSLISVDTIARS